MRLFEMLRLAPTALLLIPTACSVHPAEPSVANLEAFAKLYGYVRYFHPSDEAAELDWNAFVVEGAERVRDASSSDDLRRELEALFLPVAPTLRLTGEADAIPPPPPALTPPDTARLRVVAWQHQGMGSGNANSVYRSARTNRTIRLTAGQGNAILLQSLDATSLRGRDIRLTGSGRAASPAARAHLWLRVDRPTGPGFFDNMMDRPVTASAWTPMAIEGTVDEDAARVVLGVLVIGGDAAIDDLRLQVRDGDRWSDLPVENASFEAAGESLPVGWTAATPGWTFSATAADAVDGERILEVSAATVTVSGPIFDGHPRPGETIRKPIGRGLVAHVPSALWSRDGRTLGEPPAGFDAGPTLDETTAFPGLEGPEVDAHAVRLADVIVAWNVFQHFYPYWDVVGAEWAVVLRRALEEAIADSSGAEHRTTLRRLVAALEDGHGAVSAPDAGPRASLPFAVEWIEDSVVVVATAVPDVVARGDVIVSLDGRPAADLVEEEAALHSGTLRWRLWRTLRAFGSGQEGTRVTLEVRRAGGAVETVQVMRESGDPVREPRPDPIAEIEDDVFYVDLDRAPMTDITTRIDELAAADAVIFDLRGYPNGNHLVLTHLTDEPLRSAHWMTPRITRPDGDGEPRYRESRWNLPPAEPRFTGRIAFLTDGRAISYAESVLGIVEHYGLGEIVGQPTAGANGNVNPFRLPSGHLITWTGMRVEKHDRSQHHLVGIHPTVPVERTIVGVRGGRDEVLERALEIVGANN